MFPKIFFKMLLYRTSAWIVAKVHEKEGIQPGEIFENIEFYLMSSQLGGGGE